jgi:formylglycine-generating enzyme required for sulfatase activity
MGSNPSHWKDPDLPVEQVSWEDCQDFVKKLNEKAKSQIKDRVAGPPTEAQWEYACRAGTTTRWSFGDNESTVGENGWYNGNSGGQTHPVGKRKPNAWGLYDMHGNVWEWCRDWHGPYGGDARDPEGPRSGQERCLRSGDWGTNPNHCRSAFRRGVSSTTRYMNTGFRVALEAK